MAGHIVALLSAEEILSFFFRNVFYKNLAREAMGPVSPSAERILRETCDRDQQHRHRPFSRNWYYEINTDFKMFLIIHIQKELFK